MINIDPTNESCIYSTLHFVADQAKKYGVSPVLTFDQSLWMKARQILDAERPLLVELRKLFCVLEDFTWK